MAVFYQNNLCHTAVKYTSTLVGIVASNFDDKSCQAASKKCFKFTNSTLNEFVKTYYPSLIIKRRYIPIEVLSVEITSRDENCLNFPLKFQRDIYSSINN
jgi:hypothetical protein